MLRPLTIWQLSRRAHRRGFTRTARALKAINFLVFKAILPPQAEIEDDLRLAHYALGVVVHPNVTIGKRVKIYHHVTLAAEVRIGSPCRIHIGDDVLIGAGATIIGPGDRSLYIGDGAVVGAGAVVTSDVGPGQTVVGVPARPVPGGGRVIGEVIARR